MINNLTIGVTTVSFSADKQLIGKLSERTQAKILINEQLKRFTETELVSFLGKCDGAIVGLDLINETVLEKCPRTKVFSKYGVGLDNIDLSACEKRGVKVVSSQGVNKRSVAEEALGFMLALGRNLVKASSRLKNGEWYKDGGVQLSGKTIGIIGVGNIGRELVKLLQPFGCRILVNDIIDQSDYYAENHLIECSKEDIYREADFITVHTPKTVKTINILDADAFSMMKHTAFVINTARGGIVNQEDLKLALKSGKIAGAALDVYDTEPLQDMELAQLENIICTPHIAGNAEEAVEAMGIAAIENLALGLGL